ncbi:hypothetical protein ACH5RR_001844 [Cinchona calisaya]|uniref:F-box domain-containing protein n=1 Tax=Cinchona calisaya TaxID=153742 RepID=A0ABD3B4M7_9GENT
MYTNAPIYGLPNKGAALDASKTTSNLTTCDNIIASPLDFGVDSSTVGAPKYTLALPSKVKVIGRVGKVGKVNIQATKTTLDNYSMNIDDDLINPNLPPDALINETIDIPINDDTCDDNVHFLHPLWSRVTEFFNPVPSEGSFQSLPNDLFYDIIYRRLDDKSRDKLKCCCKGIRDRIVSIQYHHLPSDLKNINVVDPNMKLKSSYRSYHLFYKEEGSFFDKKMKMFVVKEGTNGLLHPLLPVEKTIPAFRSTWTVKWYARKSGSLDPTEIHLECYAFGRMKWFGKYYMPMELV